MRRHPVLTWTLRVLRAAQLGLLFLFVAYFVSVQVNAAAYLVGRDHPIIGGTTPPLSLHSDGAAVADIVAGLVFEAIAALIVLIAAVMFRARIRKREKVTARV